MKHSNNLLHLQVKTAILACLFTVSGLTSFSQTSGLPKAGSWLMYFGQIRVHQKWSLHAEAQFRDFGILDQPEQILLRGGANYHYSPQAVLSAGYGRITNYGYDEEFLESPSVSENRTWQQFVMRNTIGRTSFEHRYRLEQRWIQSEENRSYLDRARYLVRITLPLNKKAVAAQTVFVSFYDEIFINFSSTPFDRNRLYGALGYQFTPSLNLQAGYLAQTVGSRTRHYLQAGINHTIDLRKTIP